MFKKFFLIGFITGTLATLIALGVWQVQRLEWKNRLIAQYQAAQALPPVPLEQLLATCRGMVTVSAEQGAVAEEGCSTPEALQRLQYRRVTVSGSFQHDHELHLGGRMHYGKTGYQVLTPLTLEDGRVLLVNRGWVPTEQKEPQNRPQDERPAQVQGMVGMVRLPQTPGMFTPSNHPQKNFWFYEDIPAMEKETGLQLLPFSVEWLDPDHARDKFPVPADGKVVLRNDHLGYAVTWFALALAAAVIFWMVFKDSRPLQTRRSKV